MPLCRCMQAWYCSRDCQITAWWDEQHHEVCRAMEAETPVANSSDAELPWFTPTAQRQLERTEPSGGAPATELLNQLHQRHRRQWSTSSSIAVSESSELGALNAVSRVVTNGSTMSNEMVGAVSRPPSAAPSVNELERESDYASDNADRDIYMSAKDLLRAQRKQEERRRRLLRRHTTGGQVLTKNAAEPLSSLLSREPSTAAPFCSAVPSLSWMKKIMNGERGVGDERGEGLAVRRPRFHVCP